MADLVLIWIRLNIVRAKLRVTRTATRHSNRSSLVGQPGEIEPFNNPKRQMPTYLEGV